MEEKERKNYRSSSLEFPLNPPISAPTKGIPNMLNINISGIVKYKSDHAELISPEKCKLEPYQNRVFFIQQTCPVASICSRRREGGSRNDNCSRSTNSFQSCFRCTSFHESSHVVHIIFQDVVVMNCVCT